MVSNCKCNGSNNRAIRLNHRLSQLYLPHGNKIVAKDVISQLLPTEIDNKSVQMLDR